MHTHKIPEQQPFIQPPFLKPGDKVGICCPAGSVQASEMQDMIRQLYDWGLHVRVGCTVGSRYFKFSAPDAIRCADLQQQLDDPDIRAIFFGRGGYGVMRILEQLSFQAFLQHPKWLIGYSDITAIHSCMHSQWHTMSLHAHMGAGYRMHQRDEVSTQSIYHYLFGIPITHQWPVHSMNRFGMAEGILCGGNLALLSDLCGTPYDLETRGKLLFLEDIGEYRYNIDRMLWQLKLAGKLESLAGLIIGSFTDTQDNEIPFGMTEYEMIQEKIAPYSFPVCFGIPVGHQIRNEALMQGAVYRLAIDAEAVVLNLL